MTTACCLEGMKGRESCQARRLSLACGNGIHHSTLCETTSTEDLRPGYDWTPLGKYFELSSSLSFKRKRLGSEVPWHSYQLDEVNGYLEEDAQLGGVDVPAANLPLILRFLPSRALKGEQPRSPIQGVWLERLSSIIHCGCTSTPGVGESRWPSNEGRLIGEG